MSPVSRLHTATDSEQLAFAGVPHGTALNAQEERLLSACIPFALTVEAGREIAEIGSILERPKLILSGWVGLARLLADGRRQLVDLNIAGDLTAFDPCSGARAEASYIALSPVSYVEARQLVDAAIASPDQLPALAAALRAADGETHSRLFDHILRLGGMLAHERMAHFALDLYRRHERVGLCVAQSFPMPLTQEILGDTLGLSTVHVNRTLQQLRRDGLLETPPGRWQIPSVELLTEVASGARARNSAL